jgi:hypothetical protein
MVTFFVTKLPCACFRIVSGHRRRLGSLAANLFSSFHSQKIMNKCLFFSLLSAIFFMLFLPLEGQAVVTRTFNTLSFTQVVVVPPRTTPFLTFITFLTVSASSSTTQSQTLSVTQSIPLTRTAIQYDFISASTTRTISLTTTASTSSSSLTSDSLASSFLAALLLPALLLL